MKFTLQHNYDNNWSMKSPHFHDKLEILLSMSDGGSFFLMNNIHPLKRGTLIIMRDQVLHRSTSMEGSYERYVLHIPQKTLSEISSKQTDFFTLLNQNCCLQLDDDALAKVCTLMDQCMNDSLNIGEDILKECAFLTLLVTFCKLLEHSNAHLIPPAVFSPPVRQAIDWIDNHINEELYLDLLAEKCFVTKYHLCRIFKEETSFTIGEYIVQVRLRHATSLLKKGESVQRAGEASGFSSNSHFIRTFGSVMGISPGKYRREHISKK